MASQGCGEIDAAKQRLDVARKWEASTVDSMEAAQKFLTHALEQVENATLRRRSALDEVKEAEEHLKGVEKKWEVIDVDIDVDSPGKSKRKRQEHSSSTKHRAKRRNTRAVSPMMRRRGDNTVEFDLCALPGPLGLIVSNRPSESGELTVHTVHYHSQFFGYVQRGDIIMELDGMNTGT